MDKSQLIDYLKSLGRSQAAIRRALFAQESFEIWLQEHHNQALEDQISQHHLEGFIQSAEKGQKNLLMGLADVFGFLGRETLKATAVQMRRAMLDSEIRPMNLKDFLGVEKKLLTGLQTKGITDAFQLLQACRTFHDRSALAQELDVSYSALLDLVKMADLSRLFAVKAVRARLYLESGFDTLDKLAAEDPLALHLALVKFVDEVHFKGVPTTPKEAEGTVKAAQKMERWVDYTQGE